MTAHATTRWRRDVFLPDLAHLPDPNSPTLSVRGGRRQQGLCDRYVRADEPAEPDTLKCPDCRGLDAEGDGDAADGDAAGPPAASL